MTEVKARECQFECRVVRAAYREMPGLCLTPPQMRRLWRLDPATCQAVVNELVSDGFLRPSRNGAYVLAGVARSGATSMSFQ